jgi:hypothetical protein
MIALIAADAIRMVAGNERLSLREHPRSHRQHVSARLRKVGLDNGARILVKLESENPTGSIKDRMALAMIEAAEANGRLARGGSVVEYTGGSTGVSARRYRRSDRTSLDGGRDRNVATARTRGGSLCRNVNRRQRSRRRDSQPSSVPGRRSPPSCATPE